MAEQEFRDELKDSPKRRFWVMRARKTGNRIRRGKRTSFAIYSSGIDEYLTGEKYTWICVECGREWLLQRDARRCPHRDYVWYGMMRVYCLSRKEVTE